MELQVLLWILGGGFASTWGLCLFVINRMDNAVLEIRSEIQEIRASGKEINSLLKQHHGRLSVLEDRKK